MKITRRSTFIIKEVNLEVIEKSMNQKEINNNEWSNPENCSCGFYFSKRDTRTWVPKSIPWMGWTLNIGTTAGALWMIGFLVGLPMLVILLGIIIPQF